MNIKTEQHYHDAWLAYDDDTYDGPGSALGHGANRDEAISDLLEEIELRREDKLARQESLAQTQDRERNQ